jgi:hypothetical protein
METCSVAFARKHYLCISRFNGENIPSALVCWCDGIAFWSYAWIAGRYLAKTTRQLALEYTPKLFLDAMHRVMSYRYAGLRSHM